MSINVEKAETLELLQAHGEARLALKRAKEQKEKVVAASSAEERQRKHWTSLVACVRSDLGEQLAQYAELGDDPPRFWHAAEKPERLAEEWHVRILIPEHSPIRARYIFCNDEEWMRMDFYAGKWSVSKYHEITGEITEKQPPLFTDDVGEALALAAEQYEHRIDLEDKLSSCESLDSLRRMPEPTRAQLAMSALEDWFRELASKER